MKLKTYRAPTMADALAAVKKDLGRSAVILHTRTVKHGGILGFKRKTLVEITASDEAPKSMKKPLAPRAVPVEQSGAKSLLAAMGASAYRQSASADAVGGTPSAERAQRERRPASSPDLGNSRDTSALDALLAFSQSPSKPAEAGSRLATNPITKSPAPSSKPAASSSTPEVTILPVRNRRDPSPERGSAQPPPTSSVGPQDQNQPMQSQITRGAERDRLVGLDPASRDALGRELAEIKLLVNQVLQSSPPSASATTCGGMPESLFKHYLRLLESAVSREIADGVISAVRDELNPGELTDEAIVRTTVLRHLAALIPVAESVVRPGQTPDRRPLTIALVGPTGVGKTTTIAKLAAAYKLRQGKSVALITSDTYRIAAVDQLRTYAGIIGLPIRVVMTPGEMRAAVESLDGYDVVLIDTAGRSQHATDRLGELSEFLAAANPHEVHLVLSSTASEAVLVKTAEAFRVVKPNRVILTKLDEAVNFGVVVNVTRRLSASLSFVTTGQEVPDHIEAGRPDRLARMVLDNTMGLASSVQPPRGVRGSASPVSGGDAGANAGGASGFDRDHAERGELLGSAGGLS